MGRQHEKRDHQPIEKLPETGDDISGVQGAEFHDIVPAAPGVDVTIYKADSRAYAIWITECESGPVAHSFTVTAGDQYNALNIIVSYVMEIARLF